MLTEKSAEGGVFEEFSLGVTADPGEDIAVDEEGLVAVVVAGDAIAKEVSEADEGKEKTLGEVTTAGAPVEIEGSADDTGAGEGTLHLDDGVLRDEGVGVNEPEEVCIFGAGAGSGVEGGGTAGEIFPFND